MRVVPDKQELFILGLYPTCERERRGVVNMMSEVRKEYEKTEESASAFAAGTDQQKKEQRKKIVAAVGSRFSLLSHDF